MILLLLSLNAMLARSKHPPNETMIVFFLFFDHDFDIKNIRFNFLTQKIVSEILPSHATADVCIKMIFKDPVTIVRMLVGSD